MESQDSQEAVTPASGRTSDVQRVRWSFPAADSSTQTWLNTQHDVSRSLQHLVREAVARDGMVDVVNKPVVLPETAQGVSSATD